MSLNQLQSLADGFARAAPGGVDYWSLRLVNETSESLAVREDVPEPAALSLDRGAMLTVVAGGGVGYGATSDLSPSGLRRAFARAADWAALHAERGLFDAGLFPRTAIKADYTSPVIEPWESLGVDAKMDLLMATSRSMALSDEIVDWAAWLGHRRVQQLLVSSDGALIAQAFEYVHPGVTAVANRGSQTQRRSAGGADWPQQGGLERIAAARMREDAVSVAEEALALLDASECPQGPMDLVLTPSQMVLQIHESIGHPLELDRILGDERNYAGTSFVTLDMLGSYRYGSDKLNVTFDPGVPGELVSRVADDDGTPAERVELIRDGVLLRPLGGPLSAARVGAAMGSVATSRAGGWDRPSIDRMSNLNLEPGDGGSLSDLVGRVERGVLMDANRSWSIDDSRNKFQFGCELGREIRDGELKGLVRNPGYRGISAEFWRSLDGVGGRDSQEVRGVTNCGKGEPNQAVYVGHASPPCLFRDVAVFGGGE